MRNITASTSIAALLLTLTACGNDGGAETTPQAAECSASPEATVTSNGSEPRTTMEASPEVGEQTKLNMRMAAATSAVIDGKEAPTRKPTPIVMGIVFTIDDVTDDEITMAFAYDSVEVEGGEPTDQDAVNSLTSMSGTIRTTRNGAFIDGNIDTDSLDPALRPMADQLQKDLGTLTVPLPAEPVGVGAEWEIARLAKSGGIAICNRAIYRLSELKGDDYQLDIEIDQDIKPTTFGDQGGSIELVSGSGSGTGHSSGNLASLIPTSSAIKSTTEMEMKVEQDGKESTQTLISNVDMNLARRE